MTTADGQRLVRTTVQRMLWLGWLANLVGGAVVFNSIGFLVPIFFDPAMRWELAGENLPFVAGCFLVGGSAAVWYLRRSYRSALAWIVEDREPEAGEHARTLRLPLHTTLVTVVGWALSALVLSALNLDHSLGFVAVVASTIWLGGETTAALAYLVTERCLRPLTARALAVHQPERASTLGVRDRMLFAWSLGTMVPILGVLVVGVVGLTKTGVGVQYVAGACVFLGAVAVVVGLVSTLITVRAVADPLTDMRRALERVGQGDLDARLAIDDASEIGQLQAGFNRMADGLREREHIRDLFGRQVGRDVARAALRNGTRLGGEERNVGALFVDVIGSTSMALAMPPTEVVRLLNRFFRVVIGEVESRGGLVNKIEGDAALCVFGAPAESDDPAGDALAAARAVAARLERELPEIGFAIGISAGRAVAGNVGAEQRFEYTVIGDPVNEAARLCDLAKGRPEHVVASEAALALARDGEAEAWELGERTILRGRIDATGLASPRGL